LLRRLKSDPSIISDLPEKIERQCYSNLTDEQVRLYKGVVNNQIKEIKSTKSITRQGHVLAMLTQLKQVCNHPAQLLKEASGPLAERSGKLTYTTHLITAILERHDKVIIFSQYKEMGIRLQRHIQEHFGLDAPFMHGGTPPKKRDSLVDDFQADNYDMPVFIISLKAGGTGLNLTAATHVIHYDRWWNPAVEDQATDRAYRIGQKRNVQVHKLITEGTLEERINQLLEDKRALADTVIGTGEKWISQLNDDELLDLVSLDGDTYGGDE
jgi:SNF2 family DNA or RNA helicase